MLLYPHGDQRPACALRSYRKATVAKIADKNDAGDDRKVSEHSDYVLWLLYVHLMKDCVFNINCKDTYTTVNRTCCISSALPFSHPHLGNQEYQVLQYFKSALLIRMITQGKTRLCLRVQSLGVTGQASLSLWRNQYLSWGKASVHSSVLQIGTKDKRWNERRDKKPKRASEHRDSVCILFSRCLCMWCDEA